MNFPTICCSRRISYWTGTFHFISMTFLIVWEWCGTERTKLGSIRFTRIFIHSQTLLLVRRCCDLYRYQMYSHQPYLRVQIFRLSPVCPYHLPPFAYTFWDVSRGLWRNIWSWRGEWKPSGTSVRSMGCYFDLFFHRYCESSFYAEKISLLNQQYRQRTSSTISALFIVF